MRLHASSPHDEIYRIRCKGEIQACRAEAAEVCRGSYDVLETTGAPVEPRRVTSAPGPASTGPRYQRPKWVGHMVVACGAARPEPPAAGVVAPEAPGAAPHGTSTAPHGDDTDRERVCVPGVTQECLGPAACRGAQACLPDGEGYGPCDCGTRSEPRAAESGANPDRSTP